MSYYLVWLKRQLITSPRPATIRAHAPQPLQLAVRSVTPPASPEAPATLSRPRPALILGTSHYRIAGARVVRFCFAARTAPAAQRLKLATLTIPLAHIRLLR